MRIHDFFRPVDMRHRALKGLPAHPFRFRDVLTDTAIRAELGAQLESTPERPFMRGFALASVCEAISLARREGEGPIGEIELRRSLSGSRTNEPPPAPEGLERCLNPYPVVTLTALAVPSGPRVDQPYPAASLVEVSLIADRAYSLGQVPIRSAPARCWSLGILRCARFHIRPCFSQRLGFSEIMWRTLFRPPVSRTPKSACKTDLAKPVSSGLDIEVVVAFSRNSGFLRLRAGWSF
jgi:hypothetical protein